MSLSVFNESAPPITKGVPVDNSGWNAIATIVAARKLSDAIAKAAERRARINNEATSNDQHIDGGRAKALRLGMSYYFEAINHISRHIQQNPGNDVVGSLKEAVQHLDERLDDVINSVEDVGTTSKTVKYQIDHIIFALEESSKALDWVKCRFHVADSLDGESAATPNTAKDIQQATPCFGRHVTDADFSSIFNFGGGACEELRVFDSFETIYTNQEE